MEALIRAGMRNPVRITVKEKGAVEGSKCQRTPASLQNYYIVSSRLLTVGVSVLLNIELCTKSSLFRKSKLNDKAKISVVSRMNHPQRCI